MAVEFLWINVPLMALAFALWVGVPMWMVLRHPDRHPQETRTMPAYLLQSQQAPVAVISAAFPEHGQLSASDDAERELASATRI